MSVLAPLLLVGCGNSGGADSSDPYAEAERIETCGPGLWSATSKLDQKYDLDANEEAYANGEIRYSTYMELITKKSWEERMLQEEYRACVDGESFTRPRYEPTYTDEGEETSAPRPKTKVEMPPDMNNGQLAGRDLRGEDLEGYWLPDGDLQNAVLAGVNLSGANLEGANLSGANLAGADLSGANLKRAKLSGANLRFADLKKANLRRADLSDANLRKANFKNANLTKANLDGANVSGASFDGAKGYP